MRRHYFKYFVVALILIFSLTHLFSIGFLLALLLAATWNPWRSSIFETYISRFIAQFLIFSSFIMLFGMYCWISKIGVPPILISGLYLAFYFAGARYLPNKNKLIALNYSDVLSILLASIGIVILLVNFYLPKPSLASTIQMITSGYDNSAHLSLVETTYRGNGYVYGPYNNVKDKVAFSTLAAYPQGWHLATAEWWKGTGLDIFNGTDISLRLNMYVATFLLWQFIAVFLLSKAGIFVCELMGLNKELKKFGGFAAFCGANILIQMLIIWGSMFFGFPTFVCAICYLLLLSIFVLSLYNNDREHKFLSYSLSLLACGSITMAWLLPAPIVLLVVFIAFFRFVNKALLKQLKKITNKKLIISYIISTLLTGIPILTQVLINFKYSTQGTNQIDDGGGIFMLSNTLVFLLILFTSYVILSFKDKKHKLTDSYLAICAPLLLLSMFIYAYQIETIGQTAYFFTKTVALFLSVLGVFLSAAFVKVFSQISFSQWSELFKAVCAIMSIGIILVFTGQSIHNFTSLLDHTPYPIRLETALAKLARNGDLINNHVMVLTGVMNTDIQSTVFAVNQPLHPDSCVASTEWLVLVEAQNSFPGELAICTAKGEHFLFVTSPATNSLINDIHNPLVKTVEI